MEKKRKKLRGAKFHLINCEGTPIACGTTDENGLLCFDRLPLGKYFIEEIEAPCGYKPCHDIIPVEICPNEPCKTLEVFNEKINGKITIVKLGD